MITCLLCPSAAVADALCVPCGAKLWAAYLLTEDAGKAAAIKREPWKWKLLRGNPERAHALDTMTLEEALDIMARLEAAKGARASQTPTCDECGSMVPRDEHKPTCPRAT